MDGTDQKKPCQWRGGNDFMECATCGREFDWRKEPKPDCDRTTETKA